MRLRLLLLLLFFATPALALPPTPTVFLNEKVRLAELAVSQRATLRFDLRPIGGEHLKVLAYRYDQTLASTPVREWIINKAYGQERIDFKGLPLAVYTLIAYACDATGNQLAERAPLIHVEYGGWRAWEKFQPPIETVTTAPPAFTDIDAAINIRNQNIQIGIDPPAAVVRPGAELPLRAGFSGIGPEKLKWTLIGPGSIKATDEYHYVYYAPLQQIGSKLVRIEIQSIVHPELTASAMILVSSADPDTLNSNPVAP